MRGGFPVAPPRKTPYHTAFAIIQVNMSVNPDTENRDMTKLSLIVPCYNEERTLESCIDRVLALKGADLELEILIVDDCSRDNSLAIARSLAERHPEVVVVAQASNQGKGAALRTGFMRATGDYVGVQDADNEYDPMEYRKLLAPLLEGRADVVYGSRYLRPDTRRVLYFWHTQMNRFLTFLSNMYTDLGITDMETCYKLFRRETIQEIAPKLRENRFGFEPEVTTLVAQARCRVYECAITYNPRTYSEGKKINWRDGLRAIYCIMHYGGQTAPLPMQLAVYFVIGLICALLNLALFTAFLEPMGLAAATFAAFFVAAAANYLLCILVLFKHKVRWRGGTEALIFLVGVVIIACIDYGLTVLFIRLGTGPTAAKSIATVCGFVINFLLRKYIVF